LLVTRNPEHYQNLETSGRMCLQASGGMYPLVAPFALTRTKNGQQTIDKQRDR
jgi:hypothetical protein